MAELLNMRAVRKGYRHGGRDERVLDDVSLQVEPGAIVAVVGQRWEGKTTLLRLAAGMDLADAGAVWFQGADFALRSRQGRARLLGREIVWLDRQESHLGLKILDHIGLPMVMGRGHGRREARRLAADALELVGVGHVADKRLQDLSRWERVLVGLASAVAARPQLLVVDDLFDALGATRSQEAGDLLRSLVQELGFGVLFGVSDVDAALVAHRVLAFQRQGLRVLSNQVPMQADVLPLNRERRQARGGSRSTHLC